MANSQQRRLACIDGGYDYRHHIAELSEAFYEDIAAALQAEREAGRQPPIHLPLFALTNVIVDILATGIERGGEARDVSLAAQSAIVDLLSRVGTEGKPS